MGVLRGRCRPGMRRYLSIRFRLRIPISVCTHGFSGFKHKIAIISIPKGVVTENSSDLDSGRRPKLRSVEFSS